MEKQIDIEQVETIETPDPK
jgi:hypothetical protein